MKRLMLIKYNFQNEIRHEFYNVSVELKKKLSLNIPIKYIFPLAFIYQNTFIFLILLFLFSIKDTTIFNVVSVLIMLFNLFLPITLARTENNRLIYNPAYQTLQLGELGNKEVLRILLYSETVNFWIHNFMLEFITLFLFVVKFGINGLLLSLIWIFLISYMYQKSLLSNQSVNIKTKTAFRYLGGQVVNVMLTIIMFTILINPSHRIKFNNILNGSSIREYFKHYYQQIENNAITFFNDYTSLIYIGISILLYLLISYIFGDFILKKYTKLKTFYFIKFQTLFFIEI